MYPILGELQLNKAFIAIDLSVSNFDPRFVNVKTMDDLQYYVDSIAKENIAIGGYLERRNLYRSFDHFNSDGIRDIHLGVDIWAPKHTPIFLPLNGKLVIKNDIQKAGDYGGLLIFKHVLDGEMIHSLYGHLDPIYFDNLEIGKTYNAGSHIACLGDYSCNGRWAPHLHFQLIQTDINYPDFPGVCTEEDIEYYRKICPDPTPWIINNLH